MRYSVLNADPTTHLFANIPHCASLIPQHVRGQFLVSDQELQEEARRLVDWFTDELYSSIVDKGGCALQHNVSRFVVDPERFEDDSLECMAARGMGVIYTHGSLKQQLRRNISPDEREALLNEYYRPYHAEMLNRVSHIVAKFGRCTLIDCHSYPGKALPYEIDGTSERPDLVLGTDPIHTPTAIIDKIKNLTSEAGYSFGLNRPFAGTIVPLALYRDTRVTSFMLEINRATYMDEATTTHSNGFGRMHSLISSIVEAVSS